MRVASVDGRGHGAAKATARVRGHKTPRGLRGAGRAHQEMLWGDRGTDVGAGVQHEVGGCLGGHVLEDDPQLGCPLRRAGPALLIPPDETLATQSGGQREAGGQEGRRKDGAPAANRAALSR